MAKRKTHLVCQHLEGISARALEQYQDVIREYIRDRHGIYALYKKDRLYYVGLATNLRGRLKKHLQDKHRGLWDRFSVYLTIGGDHIKELESLLLRIVKPKGNSQSGKFPRAEDLKRRLTSDVRARQKEELLVLVGTRGRVVKATSRKRAVVAKNADTTLGPYVTRSFSIRAVHRGVAFRARVRRNGWIYWNGYVYASPSLVAKDICKHAVNGWNFWKYERAPGDWVPLKLLKR
jgi:hypothetical protein